MKKIVFACAALVMMIAALSVQAQTTALPAATQHQVSLSWTNACSSSLTCTFNVYRCAGSASTCTATSTNWQLMNSSSISATAYSDAAVTTGSTYSYEVYAVATVNGTLETSSPSNEVTVTVPLGPAPPVATGSAQ